MCAVRSDGGLSSGQEICKAGLTLEAVAERVVVTCHVEGGRHAVGCGIFETFDAADVYVAVNEAGDEEFAARVDGGGNVFGVVGDETIRDDDSPRRSEACAVKDADVGYGGFDLGCWSIAAY